MKKLTRTFMLIALMATSPWALANQDDKFTIQLNKVEQSEVNCRFLFLARNGLNNSVSNLSFETVLLDQQGSISRLTVLDFMDLPASKLRMRQFEFPNLQGDDVKQVLFNSVMTCTDGSAKPIGDCSNALALSSATNIEVLD